MKNYILFTLLITIFSIGLYAQSSWDKVEITVEKAAKNIYVLKGVGGNIGIAVSDNGVYMIDDQFAQLSEKILAAIATVTDQPVRFLVNTHLHGDHTGGNENLSNQGAIIIAHENVRKRMSNKQFLGMGQILDASPPAALPQITFTDDLTIYLDSITPMMVMHVHEAHTDGDSFVYFPNENVLHTGDVFFKNSYPYIDLNSGGSIDGLLQAVNEALFMVNDKTVIIPGHGDLATRQDLMNYRDTLMAVREQVRTAKVDGKTLEEVREMELTKEWDDTYGQGFIKPDEIVKFVYNSLPKS